MDGGGVLMSGEGPKTGCAGKHGQLFLMRIKSTGDTAYGEGSAPGLRHPIVAGDNRSPPSSTDAGICSAR